MSKAPIPRDIAASPAVERLQFVMAHLRTGLRDLSDADIASAFAMDKFPVDQRREILTRLGEMVDGYGMTGVRTPDATLDRTVRRPYAIAVLERAGHVRRLAVSIESRPPHRIRGIGMDEGVPGLAARRSTDDDAAALRQIELQTPIVSGDVRVVYDRGEDYFATERLMGDTCTIVVEKDGVPVGLNSVVNVPIAVNGDVMLGEYSYRLRILPEARGGRRVNRLLGFTTLEMYGWQSDEVYAFVAAGNDTVLSHDTRISQWSVRPERIVIDTVGQSGPPGGRPATAADCGRIIDLLDRAHGHEELYITHTRASLTARLERQRDLYSWQHLYLGERAVVGVWPAGIHVIRETPAGVENDVRALVLDYGYEPGAEDELAALVRAACANLASAGTTELTLFTGAQSSAYSRLAPLAKRVEPYVLSLRAQEPEDLATRGVYVDQLYF
jgi:hypothetical protein